MDFHKELSIYAAAPRFGDSNRELDQTDFISPKYTPTFRATIAVECKYITYAGLVSRSHMEDYMHRFIYIVSPRLVFGTYIAGRKGTLSVTHPNL